MKKLFLAGAILISASLAAQYPEYSRFYSSAYPEHFRVNNSTTYPEYSRRYLAYPEYYHSSYPENYFGYNSAAQYPEYYSYNYPESRYPEYGENYPEYSHSGNYFEYSTYPEYNFGYPEAAHVLPEYWEKPYGESAIRQDYPEDVENAGCNWCLKIVSTLTQQLMKKEAAFELLKNTCDAKAHAKRQKQEAVDLVNVITAYNKYIKNLEESMASENDATEKRAIMNKLSAFYQYRAEAQAQINELL